MAPIFIKGCGRKKSLSDCTWAEIEQMAESGGASRYWHVGDKKTVVLSGDVSGTFEVQVADFDFYDKADGSGRAGVVFAFTKNVIEDAHASYGQSYRDTVEITKQNDTDMLGDELIKIKNSLPSDLKALIKTVKVKNAFGTTGLLAGSGPHYGPRSGAVKVANVDLFPPSYAEIKNGESFRRRYTDYSVGGSETEIVQEGDALELYRYSSADDLRGGPLDKGGRTFLRTVYSTYRGYYPGYIYIKSYDIQSGKMVTYDSSLSYRLTIYDEDENVVGTGATLGLCPMFCI
ncbi:MAG: hypothetical protein NC548_26940 [Lachnospiraceae bacterium]|nr:hypothetical protein [Lachnospiraceae bacterium]